MATSFINACRFTPTLGGTTDWTYSSAVTGYQSPAAAGAVNNQTFRYRSETSDLSLWEEGYGQWNSSTGVLTRAAVSANSAGTTAKINFTSTPQVAIIALAEDLVRTHSVTPNGRLTLTSGTPVTTSDVTGATSVYYTPGAGGGGNLISLFDGANWIALTFAETTLSLSGLTASTNYDVWGRISAGVLALDTTAWTNDTTRATAIAQQDGVDVKSGDPTRRLLGTIRITSIAGQTEDSRTLRYVSNRYNADVAPMQALEPAVSWSYSTNGYRQANANTANQLDFVLCTPRMVAAEAMGAMQGSATSAQVAVGIGLDSTSADSSTTRQQATAALAGTGSWTAKSNYAGYVAAGRHYLAWLESCPFANSGTVTMFGNPGPTLQCGITGALAR